MAIISLLRSMPKSVFRFHLDKGKAVFEYLPTLWYVNPDTW